MANTRSDVVDQIKERLGAESTFETAERVFDVLRADKRVYHDQDLGWTVRKDVDVAAVAAALPAT